MHHSFTDAPDRSIARLPFHPTAQSLVHSFADPPIRSNGDSPTCVYAQSPIRTFAGPSNRPSTYSRIRPFADERKRLTAEMPLHFTAAEGCLPKESAPEPPILPTRPHSPTALLRLKNERPGNRCSASEATRPSGENGYWYTNSLSCHLSPNRSGRRARSAHAVRVVRQSNSDHRLRPVIRAGGIARWTDRFGERC